MGTPSSSSTNWQIMTNDFKYIITEAIFGDYAHFGSFVINGDWMISVHGKINGSSYGGTIDNPDYYRSEIAYTWFDPLFPKGKGISALKIINSQTDIPYSTRWTQLTDYFHMDSSNTYIISITGHVRQSGDVMHFRCTYDLNDFNTDIYIGGIDSTTETTITKTIQGGTTADWFIRFGMGGSSQTGYITNVTIECTTGYNYFIPKYAIDGRTGAGHLAGGNITWDEDGNAEFAGTVNATSGTIGGMTIDGNKITGTKNNSNVIIEPGTIQIANPVDTQQVITLNAAASEFYNSNINVFGDVFVGNKLTAGGLKLGTSYVSYGSLQTLNARLNSNDSNIVFCIGCTSVTTYDGYPIFGPDNEEHASPWNGIDRTNCIFVYGFNHVGSKYGWNMFYCG
jgi:hypothetical protein